MRSAPGTKSVALDALPTAPTGGVSTESRTPADYGPRISTLSNGLRIATHNMPHLETTSLGVWVACGSRNESRSDNGISHFLEHMAFKGTARRSARDIAEEIEQVGGDLNAATSLETTAYYARVMKDDVPLALDILADILNNPVYDAAEIERERGVILQEIAATRDTPDDLVFDLNQELAFAGQPVGRPILGTNDSVSSFTNADLKRFLHEHYLTSNMVIAAAGAVDHDEICRLTETHFKGRGTPPQATATPSSRGRMQRPKFTGGTNYLDRPFEQSHLVMGFEAPSYRDDDIFAAQVFSGLFGGGMSSRLFQEVREKRGLCYSIYSSCWGLTDSGVFNIYAATSPENMDELSDVLRSELMRAAESPPAPRELQRAKAQLKAGLLMSLESSAARAEQMARHLLIYDRLLPVAELIGKVDAVSAEDVRLVAMRFQEDKPMAFTIIGKDAGKDAGKRDSAASPA